jgi:TolA-binding protein
MATDEYELEEIKREIVESRSLTIKTNNLVNALSADVKSIAKRQQGYERKFFVNGATAYAVTICVMLILSKFFLDARLESVRMETKDDVDRLAQLEKELKAAQGREDVTARASRAAAEYYDLVVQNKRRQILDKYPETSRLPLTKTERAVFDSAVERARDELSLIAYQTGLDHAKMGRWQEAQSDFEESLRLKPNAAHSSQATYQLGITLRALGQQRLAIPQLMQLSEASADREVMDDATLLLAQLQIDIQAWNDAKTTLRSFVRRFPKSALINDARAKLAELELLH